MTVGSAGLAGPAGLAGLAGLVLAAGEGRRFGGPKAVVELAGERLVDRAVRVLAEAGIATTYVVTGAIDLVVPGAVVVSNPDWADGMGSSLRVGLAAVRHAGAAGAVVLPVDQPGVSAAAVSRVIAAAFGAGAGGGDVRGAVVVATYAGRGGHPVLLGADHWESAAALAVGDVGARAFLQSRPEQVTRVECSDVADGGDVDVPADLERFSGGEPGS